MRLYNHFLIIASFWPLCLSLPLSGNGLAASEDPEWQSEQLSERASALLADTLSPLKGKKPSAGLKVSPEAKCTVLRPERFRETFSENGLQYRRHALGSVFEPTSLSEALAGLQSPLDASLPQQYKLKILSVVEAPAPVGSTDKPLTTRLLFFLNGATKTGRLEHRATWEARWQISMVAGQPEFVLHGLKCLTCEEAESATHSPWFADCTQALLGGLPEVAEQVGRGNPYWRSRLQKCLDQFVYGHRGIAVGDADGDGLDDVYLCQEGGLPNRLLRQKPDGTVEDISASSGVDIMEMTRSALFLDLDEDGDEDLTLAVPQGLLMFENDGTGKYQQRVLLPQAGDAFSLAAADYDGNGYVDIFVCTYQAKGADAARLPYPAPFYDANNGGENFLVANAGRWKFENATNRTGLGIGNNRFSFSAAWTDYNNDGLLDLAVVNDFGRNNLYQQTRDALGTIRFTDVMQSAGLENGAFGMGISVGDVNRDGWLDIHTANMFSSAGHRITTQPIFKPGLDAATASKFRQLASGNSLFLNNKGHFSDISEPAGIAMGRWSWGCHFADINNDGWEDLLVGNGNITGHLDEPDL